MLMMMQVSAPSLQECTNSHVLGLTEALRVGPILEEWPTTPEEYGVFALRVRTDDKLRASFARRSSSPSSMSSSSSATSTDLRQNLSHHHDDKGASGRHGNEVIQVLRRLMHQSKM